ncbi:MAG: hypothetical protein KKF65_04390, partial [Nanoarchaeota archaeon]|nr:hypothetical protein [Nanoarchaeota archaeon]
EITKMIPSLMRNPTKVPETILNQQTELEQLKAFKQKLEKEYKCTVDVETGDNSSEIKAKQANPGKPAIIIE